MNIDQLLVTHCAPTLAGIKMAALICVAQTERYEDMVAEYNHLYNKYGLFFKTLGNCKGRNLLYVYRQQDVRKCLAHPAVQEFLAAYGYAKGWHLEATLERLASRFVKYQEFPHELGVFLGYPLADVEAFITHKGQNAICCGEWKVYTDECYARGQFARYEHCRQNYKALYDRGYSMNHLIIA